MANDDEVRDDASSEETFATAGPRRSTFTPPPAGTQPPSSEALGIDDDALADAMAAEFSRLDSGTITIPGLGGAATTAPVAESAPAPVTAPEPESAPEPEPEPEPFAAPEPEPTPEPAAFAAAPVPTPDSAPAFAAEPESAPEPEAGFNPTTAADPSPAAPPTPPPVSEAPAPEATPEPAPWSSFPAPDPSQAVPIPDERPLRRSLPDDELLEWVDEAGRQPGGTLSVIEQLESQLRLREEEAREFRAWEDRMRSLGTPEALDAVEEARPEYTGVLPDVPVPLGLQTPPAPETGSFVLPETPMAEWPAPHFEDVVEPVPPPAPVAEVPVFDPPAPEAAPYPVFEAPPAPAEPPSLPTWDIAPPSAAWSPGPEYGIDPEPEVAPEPVAEPDVEPSFEPEPVVETEPPLSFEQLLEPQPVVEPEPVAEPEPALSFEQLLEPQPVVEPEPIAEPEPQPTFEPEPEPTLEPAPEPTPESGPVIEPEPAFTFEPTTAPEPEPTFEPIAEPDPEPAFDWAREPEPAPFAPPPLVDPSLPAASQVYEPTSGTEEDVYVIDEAPTAQVSVPFDPQPDFQFQPEPEPEPESASEAVAPTDPPAFVDDAPPPLVEPPVFGGPPLLPSQTHPPLSDPAPEEDQPLDGEAPAAEPTRPEPFGGVAPAAFDFRPDAPLPPVAPAPSFSFDDLLSGEPAIEAPEAVAGSATEVPAAVAEPDAASGFDLLLGEAAPADGDHAEVAATLEPEAADFDALLGSEEPPLHSDPEPATATDSAPESIFIEPMPVAAGEPVPTDTDSIPIIDREYEEELDDDTIDETDRIFDGLVGAVSVDTAGIAVVNPLVSPPSGPISTVRVPEDEVVLLDNEPIKQRVFSIEETGAEPTPTDHRVGRAARLFWLWFAANSSILSLGLGATVFAVGMSLRQSIVSVLAGVALSFIPLGLTTLAGKRSGQPTMIVSRATFGLLGNVVPAILALITRLFWGAVLLWLLASSVAIVLVGASLDGSLGDRALLLISLAGAFLVALLVAFAGYPLFARIQLILSIISGILIVGLVAMTAKYIDLPAALTTPDGPWLLTVTGAVLVFSFVGLVWANSGADLARYQRVGTSGASSMLWATFGTTLPSFLLIGYGALLAASDAGIASGFLLSPLDTLALMLPSWYPIPLIAATALSLLSGITLTIYSGGFALQAIGVQVKRQWSVVIVAVLLAAIALLLTFGVTGGITELFRDLATTLAVPTAAWAGIFAAETMIRNRRFESQSLTTRGGVYPDVRWANLIGLLLISAIGFALTSATVTWLSWQGYGFTLLGIPLDGDLAGTDMGVLVALVLGLLTPILTGIPAIRRQETARV